ncbi:MAG: hypothetical protein A3K77_06540 [Euryarchaeota archaeon RBG_13_31_8]|nr:MAG: hypothetical protein A3K77_06540 [Euryarchaeota archaeon RBG_13_31_8]
MKKERTIIVFLVVAILVLSAFVVLTRLDITEINDIIAEATDEPSSVRILSDTSSGTNPLTVNFKPLLLNTKGEIKYYWEFGDGNASTEDNPTYIYQSSGIFNVVLNIESGGTNLSDNYNITVFPNNPPKIKIKLSRTTGFRPCRIGFDVEAFDPEGENLTYTWVLKYPSFYGYEKKITFNTKNFSKLFIRNGNYVAELTVTDEVGNAVTDFNIIQIGKSQAEQLFGGLKFVFLITLPSTMNYLWPFILKNPVTKYLDNHWLNWSKGVKSIVKLILWVMGIIYDPPIPKAKLAFSEVGEINLSAYVNETGVVDANATVSRSFIITNIDDLNIAKNIFITMDNPFTDDEGLADELEKKELVVSIEDPLGTTSDKLFFNALYTPWGDSFVIDKLVVGSNATLKLTVSLEKGGVFNKGTYQCKLFAYQEKSLDKPEYIDEIPFTIVV